MPVHNRYPEFISNQRRFFDELITEDWHTYHSQEWDTVRRFEVGLLLRHLRPGTILDIGCGCGFHDPVMAGYGGVERVDAIDYSPKSVERAEEAYPHPKVRRWVADCLADPLPGGYDLVVSFQVLEHLDQPAEYFRRCVELLRPGGHAAVFMPNRLRLDNRLRLRRGQEPLLCDPQHYREYDAREVTELALAAGLGAVKVLHYGFSSSDWPWTGRLGVSARLRLGRLLGGAAQNLCGIFEKRP
jgi:SAM-dependent methyltransferase